MNTVKLKLGQITSPFGIAGWVNFSPFVDAAFNWDDIRTVYIQNADQSWRSLTLTDLQTHKPLRLKFAEIDDRTMAEALKSQFLWIDESTLPPLPDGEFYEYQLIGAPVQLVDGTAIGRVTQILLGGGTQLLQISDGCREVLIPINAENIQELKPTLIIVHPLDGLLDL